MTASTSFATSNVAGVNLNIAYTVPQTYYPENSSPPFAVGTQATTSDGSVWVFVQANGAVSLNGVVVLDNTFQATPITSSAGLFGNRVAVAAGVAFSDNDYGWVQVSGSCAGLNVADGCLPDAQLATTATGGVLDDAVTTGTKNISGIIILATNSAGSTAAKAGILNFPIVGTTN